MNASSSNMVNKPPHKRLGAIECCKDRISNLPVDVIAHILSRMPTKDAVRTTALSKNWKSNWIYIYNVVFDFEYMSTTSVDFVHMVLSRTRNNSAMLRSFRLSYSSIDPHFRDGDSTFLETWLSEVLKRNVQYLEIEASYGVVSVSPESLSGWSLLSELKLSLFGTLKLPANSAFPNLKKLILGNSGFICIKTEEISNTGRVIVNFPVLEVLELAVCKWLDVKFVEIHAPELICLRTQHFSFIDFEIKIFADKLAMYESVGCLENYVLALSAPAVTYASLVARHRDKIGILKALAILEKFPALKHLKLSGCAVEPLMQLNSGFAFPTFDQLKELQLMGNCQMEVSIKLLHVLPYLQVLEMDVQAWVDYDLEEPLPPKTAYNLEDVKFLNFSEHVGQYELAKFVLENAKSLKKMSVEICAQSGTEEKVYRRLSKLLPKTSSCVLVVSRPYSDE